MCRISMGFFSQLNLRTLGATLSVAYSITLFFCHCPQLLVTTLPMNFIVEFVSLNKSVQLGSSTACLIIRTKSFLYVLSAGFLYCYYSFWFSFARMSGAAFPSPAAEMAEINRLQYEMEYTEGISQRMRVPEKLKVAPQNADLEKGIQEGFPNASVTMQVPERIVVAGMSASE